MKAPRLSLLNLLLITALIASWLMTAMLWRDVGPLRREVRQLRDETGRLTIVDKTKLHAIAISTDPVSGYEWAWRVYIPPGKRCQIRTANRSQDSRGASSSGSGSGIVLGEGEHKVRAVLRPGEKGQWSYKVSSNGSNVGGSLAMETNPPNSNGRSAQSESDTRSESVSFGPDKTVKLLKTRIEESFNTPPDHEVYIELEILLEPF